MSIGRAGNNYNTGLDKLRYEDSKMSTWVYHYSYEKHDAIAITADTRQEADAIFRREVGDRRGTRANVNITKVENVSEDPQ